MICEIEATEKLIEALMANLEMLHSIRQQYDPQDNCPGILSELSFASELEILHYYLLGLKNKRVRNPDLPIRYDAALSHAALLLEEVIGNVDSVSGPESALQKLSDDEHMDNMDGSISAKVFMPLEKCLRASIILDGIGITLAVQHQEWEDLSFSKLSRKVDTILLLLLANYDRMTLDYEWGDAFSGWAYMSRLNN